MLNRFSEQGFHYLIGFWKYYFHFWELRITKNEKKFAFMKTYRPWYCKWLARYVFGFFIFSFFMQILNSQWIKFGNFFLLFFREFLFKSAKIARQEINIIGSALVVCEWVGALSGLDTGPILKSSNWAGAVKWSSGGRIVQICKFIYPPKKRAEWKADSMNGWMNEWMNKWNNW